MSRSLQFLTRSVGAKLTHSGRVAVWEAEVDAAEWQPNESGFKPVPWLQGKRAWTRRFTTLRLEGGWLRVIQSPSLMRYHAELASARAGPPCDNSEVLGGPGAYHCRCFAGRGVHEVRIEGARMLLCEHCLGISRQGMSAAIGKAPAGGWWCGDDD